MFVRDKPNPSAMFSDVTINVNVDDKQCRLELDDVKSGDRVTNNNIIDDSRKEGVRSEEESDTLLWTPLQFFEQLPNVIYIVTSDARSPV